MTPSPRSTPSIRAAYRYARESGRNRWTAFWAAYYVWKWRS